MLARPEKDKRSLDGCLVASPGGVTHAGKETAFALRVTDVCRRHWAAVHEGVPERDVPRLESIELVLEVLATALKSCLAVRHAPERGQRLRRPADARRGGDQRRDVLHVEFGRGALGEVLPKRVVEPVERGVRGAL